MQYELRGAKVSKNASIKHYDINNSDRYRDSLYYV